MLIELGRSGKPGVVIVDDEPQIFESIADLLRRDYHVFGTDDIEEALRLLATHDIAILLTDQRMPKTTGAELLARAAAISPDTFRVLFTGYSDIQAVIRAVNEGRMYYYMVKPWDPEKLLSMVAGAARHHNLVVANRKLMERLRELTAKTSPPGPPPSPTTKDEVAVLEKDNLALNASLNSLTQSFEHLQAIQHIISACMECGKIRTADVKWEEVGTYLKKHKVFLSHGYCPDCLVKVTKEFGLEP